MQRGNEENYTMAVGIKAKNAPLDAVQKPKDTLGRPLRDLRISLLDQCNFRCTYCMPESKYHEKYQFLKRHERMTHDEIVRLTSIATKLGVSKVRLTGGEPLLDKNIVDLVKKLSRIEHIDDLALTTNATLLKPIAKNLAEAGLHRVTISLDSIDEEIFRKLNGDRGDLETVLAAISAAEKAGLSPIKINTVVQRGINDHKVIDLLDYFRGTKHVVRLIEFMDVGTQNSWSKDKVVPSRDLLKIINSHWPVRPLGSNYSGEVAKRYRYEDGQGEIGFITSISEPFCGECSRARLSANGILFTCLFATDGANILKPLREGADDQEMEKIISNVWLNRSDRYSEQRDVNHQVHELKKVEMYRIGG